MFQPTTPTMEVLTIVSDLLRVLTLALVSVVGWIVREALKTLKDIQKEIVSHEGRLSAVEARVDEHHRMAH